MVQGKIKKKPISDNRFAELAKEKGLLEKRQDFLKAINNFSSELIKANNIDDVLWLITGYLIDKFGFEDCVVYLLDDEGLYMKKVASHSATELHDRIVKNEIMIPLGEGIVGSVAETGQAELVPDTRKDPRYIIDDANRLSELAVPILNNNKVIGVIDSEHSDENFYTPDHLEALLAVANLSSGKISNLNQAKKEEISDAIIRESEARNKTILNSALDAVISSSSDGRVTFWNLQAETTFGWKKEEAIGKKFGELILPPALRKKHEIGMKHYLKTGEEKVLNKRIEINALRKDLSIFPIELTISPILVDGKMSFNAFIRDISERKRDEQLLKKQYEELEKVNIELDRFAYSVTHDLKSPLGNLQLLISLARDEKNSKKVFQYYDMIDSGIVKMQNFIDELIADAINTNTETINEHFNLETIVCDAIEEHRYLDNFEKIQFEVQIKGEKELFTDLSRVRIALSNLISNAIKYHDFTREKPFVRIESVIKSERIVMSITDNGVGIKPSDTDNIFKKFYRCDSQNASVPGSGIGLYILKETLNKIDGTISVTSSKGEGTTFTISLPRIMQQDV